MPGASAGPGSFPAPPTIPVRSPVVTAPAGTGTPANHPMRSNSDVERFSAAFGSG